MTAEGRKLVISRAELARHCELHQTDADMARAWGVSQSLIRRLCRQQDVPTPDEIRTGRRHNHRLEAKVDRHHHRREG